MIVKTRFGDRRVEARATGEWGTSSVIPQPGVDYWTRAGIGLTGDDAWGLPAVSNVIRSPSDVIGSLPFMTYSRDGRTRAEEAWQWQLFHEEPDDEVTGTFQFFYDFELSLEATQNAFIQKAKSRSRVEAVYVIDPQRVAVYRDKDTGQKLFDVHVSSNKIVRGLTTDQIHHVRGFSPCPGSVAGTSLVQSLRDQIGNMVAVQRFEGDYFRNGANAPFFFTGANNQTHAKQLLDLHNQEHQGPGNQHKPGALWGNADVKALMLSAEDAQYVQVRRMSVEDACRIWRWPIQFLEITESTYPHDENAFEARLLKYYVLPRLKRIERSLAADKDLYAGSGLIGEFLTAALERADFLTRMRGYKDARQGGWATANEIRQPENLPPHPDGDTLLQTPTGSAPNDVGPTDGGGGDPIPADGPSGRSNGRAHEEDILALLEGAR